MDANTLESVRAGVHASSLAVLCLVVLAAIIGTAKPQLLRKFFKEFAERKYILASSVFICLLCGTVFTATQSISHPYDSRKDGISNTAGWLENPNRQVYNQSTGENETVPADSGSNQDAGSPKADQPARQEAPTQANSAQPQGNMSPSQPAGQPEPSEPPAKPDDKNCFPLLSFICR